MRFYVSYIYRFISLLGLIACLFLSSCSHDRLDVDVSQISVSPVKIARFDRDFFALNADNIVQKLPELQSKYPGFAELFVRNILCHGGINDSSCIPEITRFVNDKDMRQAYDECQKIFPDMNAIEDQLTEVFRHYKYYYPYAKLPNMLTMMSGFNYSIATADSTFSIALEKYLGGKNAFYEMLRFPNYKRMTMQKEYITNDVVKAWMIKAFPNNTKNGTLLNEMIYQGKLLYMADAMMPAVSDTIKMGFTKKQLDWCTENENNMWG